MKELKSDSADDCSDNARLRSAGPIQREKKREMSCKKRSKTVLAAAAAAVAVVLLKLPNDAHQQAVELPVGVTDGFS